MAHFFFKLDGGDACADVVELDLPNVERAHMEARDSARDMLVDGAGQGEDRAQWRMTVTDEAGQTVLQMPFSAAFRIH